MIVVAGKDQSLLGRDWLAAIKLNWSSIARIATSNNSTLEGILTKHSQLFKEELGTFTGPKATIQVQPTAVTRFHKERPVPFTIRDAVGQELDHLESEGIIDQVSHSDWAAPIVPVPEKNGTFRLCGDYKVTVNPCMDVNQYPLPKPSDLFTALAGGDKFSTLD